MCISTVSLFHHSPIHTMKREEVHKDTFTNKELQSKKYDPTAIELSLAVQEGTPKLPCTYKKLFLVLNVLYSTKLTPIIPVLSFWLMGMTDPHFLTLTPAKVLLSFSLLTSPQKMANTLDFITNFCYYVFYYHSRGLVLNPGQLDLLLLQKN